MNELQEMNIRLETQNKEINKRLGVIEDRLSIIEECGEDERKVMNQRILSLDKKLEIKESRRAIRNMGRSNLGAQEEPQPCSSRDVIEMDVVVNKRGSLSGMFVTFSMESIQSVVLN